MQNEWLPQISFEMLTRIAPNDVFTQKQNFQARNAQFDIPISSANEVSAPIFINEETILCSQNSDNSTVTNERFSLKQIKIEPIDEG